MANPIKPTGLDPAEAVRAVADAAEVDGESFRIEATALGSPVGQPDALEAAVREVAADIRAGNLPDHAAAADAVVIRLVNLRFGHLPPAKREKMILHVHERLHTDPAFNARIDELIARSTASGAADE